MESTMVDVQAEAEVIATLLFHPDFILHTEYLKAKYFYDVFNGSIYWAIQQLYQNGVDNIDAINLMNMLNSNASVKRVVAENNLSNLNEFIDLAQYAARHTLDEYKLAVKTVVTMSFKRDLTKVTRELQSQCLNGDLDIAQLNSLVNKKTNELTEKYLTSNDIELFGTKVDDLWSQIENRRNESGIYGIPSKYPSIGEYFTYEPGELVLLKARMKRGKSAFFLNEAMHKLKAGVPTLYFDTEMSSRLFYERVLANLSGVDIKKIKSGEYTSDEGNKIMEAHEWMKKQPFVHMYLPTTTDEEIYSTCKILKYKMNLGFVVYDYIKGDMVDSSALYNYLGARCDFLKNSIAGELNLPVLAGAQLNRNGMIADSDKLERYASVSMLWREKTGEEIAKDGGLDAGNYCLNINLNRLGEQMPEEDYINFSFAGNVMQIGEAKKKHILEASTPFGK